MSVTVVAASVLAPFAPAVALDETLAALPRGPATIVAAGAGDRTDRQRRGCGGSGAVTLVGGLALLRGSDEREAAVLAGVVDLDQCAVLVLRHNAVAGEEKGID